MAEIGRDKLEVLDPPADGWRFLVGQLEKIIEDAELMQHLQGRGMDRVAPKIAEEIDVLFQDHDIHPGPRE
jgi:hypothetical protein